MDGDPNIFTSSSTEKERALQEKIVRLEKELEDKKSQIGKR